MCKCRSCRLGQLRGTFYFFGLRFLDGGEFAFVDIWILGGVRSVVCILILVCANWLVGEFSDGCLFGEIKI